ncbi:odorant receptor Or1-like [Helicoverpa zea]|uniref:odorant receptor Or1-like n=1 Tax=Helicoverpa zea TaxID=7113 RepID=UPI001F584616|nr:odorant receptor Or1-like [Helicoverpa zea]
MGVLIRNATMSVSISLTALQFVGFWAPEYLGKTQKQLYTCLTVFSFMFLLGTYLIIQVVDLFLIWGDIAMMTSTAFLLFTNMAQAAKIVNIVYRKERIQRIVNDCDAVLSQAQSLEEKEIVKSCNREMIVLQILYFSLTLITSLGWATSAEPHQLPLRAWYPYDTTKSPTYELTYVHQVGALLIAAYLNVAKDTLVAALIAQCRCRLRLLGYALRTLDKGMGNEAYTFTSEQEKTLCLRLGSCVEQHQKALDVGKELQECFSEPTFAQLTVSLIIICATAFQLSMGHSDNMVRLLSMGTYLLNMTFQVFIYCYQGNQLSEESSEIAGAAYECPWYKCSVRVRRGLLIVMVRTRRALRLTAGGFTTLSLASFMAIIKASYSLFTLLQQVIEE